MTKLASKILSVQVVTIAPAGTNRTTQLSPSWKYGLVADSDCWIKQGASTVTAVASTANNLFLAKGAMVEIMVSDANDGFIACVGASGTLCVARLEGAS